jgi:uncharacterized protein
MRATQLLLFIALRALALTVIVLSLAVPAHADGSTRVLLTSGEAELPISTDRAMVTLAVEDAGNDPTTLQASIAERVQNVLAVLEHPAVSRVHTTGVQLSPRYRHENGERVFAGYQASNTLRAEVRNPALGVVLDAAVAAGANRIHGIDFAADPERLTEVSGRALGAAVDDALGKAQAVLAHLGFEALDIIEIHIDEAPLAVPVSGRAAFESPMMLSAVSTPIMAGEQTVRARVSLRIAY